MLLPVVLSFKQPKEEISIEESCRLYILEHISEIIKDLDQSIKIVDLPLTQSDKLRQLTEKYHHSRKHYKKIEFFAEYYSPFEMKYFVNGPLVKKFDIEVSSQIYEPQGFQVIEEILFTEGEKDLEKLKKQYTLLQSKLEELKIYYSIITLETNKITESLKLEVIRIMCLTMNGYDCTINKETITETIYSLKGINHILTLIQHKQPPNAAITNAYTKVDLKIKQCISKLSSNTNSDTFDRLTFEKQFLDPTFKVLNNYFNTINIAQSELKYAVNFKSNSFFHTNGINKQYFSIYQNDTINLVNQKELGKILFYDPILSGNNQRACASCHHSEKGFTDGLEKSRAYEKNEVVKRNSPTLLNAAFQKLYFYDGRMFNLEEQAGAVFHDKNEMNTNGDDIVVKLRQSQEYKNLFRNAFNNTQDSAITFYAVIKSIAEFIKSLDARNSKFDKYLKGEKIQLSLSEKNGYNLFSGKALCGSCHFFPLFNGTVPPMYNDNEFEVIGVPSNNKNKELDADEGRAKITHNDIHKHAFKTPTLRNIAITAPYMHNGIYANLDEVLEFYNKGGGVGFSLKVENQTLPFDSLGLSKKEMKDIKNFLLTLTDTSHLPKPPKSLPKFRDSDLNNRKVGGEY